MALAEEEGVDFLRLRKSILGDLCGEELGLSVTRTCLIPSELLECVMGVAVGGTNEVGVTAVGGARVCLEEAGDMLGVM